MAAITLKANVRDYKGRSKSNSARRAGKVPGVFYLGNSKNIPIEVDALDLRHLVYTSETHIIDLELNDGSKEMAVLREVQFDPITDRMMHFDLIGVVKGQLMIFEVPVVLEGVPAGVRDGAVLTQTVHKVEVECLPRNLPEYIAVDVSPLVAGDSLSVSDINIDDVNFITNAGVTLAIVSHPRAAEETEVEEGAAEAMEPEVIGRETDEEAEA